VSLLYLYALAPEPPATPLGAGLAGEPLRAVTCGPFQALVGELRERPAFGAEALAGHDAAVRRLAEALPALLPARFGEWAPDERALAERLGPQAGELGEALALVRGCVQMTLRVFGVPAAPSSDGGAGPSPPAPLSHPHSPPPGEGAPPPENSPAPEGPGTRYLAARRRTLAEAQEVPEVAGLRATLLPLLRAERVERHGTGTLLATLSHLVERERLPSYLELFERESRRLAGVRVAASGPWPPYAFAPGSRA
jgi:hypothetical protein